MFRRVQANGSSDEIAGRSWLSKLHGVSSLLVYLILSAVFFGRALVGHFSTASLGAATYDPSMLMWCLVWWPYAIIHGLNPFISRVVWAPSGANLTWTTSIPLAGWLASPLTWTFGPIPAYNTLCLLCPALAGWSTFILCRYITRRYWPSLLGGYIFGFSPYMVAQMRAHLQLVLIFPVPLAVYMVLRRLADDICPRTFTLLLALTLVAQFLFFTEIFATMTLFGAIVIALALALTSAETRRRLCDTLPLISCSYGLALLILTPYLYYLFASGVPRGPIWPPALYSTDLLNFLIPTPATLIGSNPILRAVSSKFAGNIFETDSYLSPPLLIVFSCWAFSHWRQWTTKLLTLSLLIVCILSLGPRMHMAGEVRSIHITNWLRLRTLPWSLVLHLPLIDKALPCRLSMYAFLGLAIVAALWSGATSAKAPARFATFGHLAAAGAIVLFLLPNVSVSFWATSVDLPAFVSKGFFRSVLAPGENVLVLGPGMLWQAEAGMYFRMATGYIGPGSTPPELEAWPIVRAFHQAIYLPDAGSQLKAFIASREVAAVVVSDNELSIWRPILSALGVEPLEAGGVSLYKTPGRRRGNEHTSAIEMETKADAGLFDALLRAADKYLSDGGSLAELTPLCADKLKLVPHDWLTGSMRPMPVQAERLKWWPDSRDPLPDPRLYRNLWLGAWVEPVAASRAPVARAPQRNPDLVGVGLFGTFAALKPTIERYGTYSRAVYFDSKPLHGSSPPKRISPDDYRLLVMVFDRAGLTATAAMIQPGSAVAARAHGSHAP